MDLDDFKRVNDEWGHDAGDELLQQFAERVREALREDDTFARLGGDEFAVLLPGVRDRQQAAAVAGNLARVISAPFQLRCGPRPITCSVGGSLFPADGTQPDLLLKAADRALYRVKHGGRNGIDVGAP
jgi:diguanylate cyclase (GGDEF)-like protein